MAIEVTKASLDYHTIDQLTFTEGSVNIPIIVKSYNVVRNRDENNIGSIIEKYRLLKEESPDKASQHWAQKAHVLARYLTKKFPTPWPDFVPDYICVVGASDELRLGFINRFAHRIVSNYPNSQQIDFSQHFRKIDQTRSITQYQDEANADIFELDVREEVRPTKILLIDDVVNTGATIECFVKKAIKNGLIINPEKIEIRVICIYNRPKLLVKQVVSKEG